MEVKSRMLEYMCTPLRYKLCYTVLRLKFTVLLPLKTDATANWA
jgi:hypothetical protein